MAALGFDVNVLERVAPLHLAALAGDHAMAELLLKLGADTTLHDKEFNATPAGWASHNRHHELAERSSHTTKTHPVQNRRRAARPQPRERHR